MQESTSRRQVTSTAWHAATASQRAILQEHYAALLANDDSNVRRVAAHQRERLRRAEASEGAAHPSDTSRWAYLPVTVIFSENGNVLHSRGHGRYETGHEPCHGSKSGRCVTVDASKGLWYCRSCQQGGTAVTFVAALHGWSYRQAARWLVECYGPPGHAERHPRRGPRLLEA